MSNTATLNLTVDFVTRAVTVVSSAPLPIGSDVWCDVNFSNLNDAGSVVAITTAAYTVTMTVRQYEGGPILATNSSPAAAEGSILYGLYLPLSGAALLEALQDSASGNLIAEISWTMANPYVANLGPSTITTRSKTFTLPYSLYATAPEAAESTSVSSTLGGGSGTGTPTTITAQFLSQAGGGAGGTCGGGGAGGYKSSSITLTRGTVYAIEVGLGGAVSTAGVYSNGGNGGNSGIVGIDSTITHGGGGGGGQGNPGGMAGSNGGCGGGGGANEIASGVQGAGGTGISGEGYAGGYSPGGSYSPCGGGGGAGGPGSSPGAGGPGISSTITGALQTYGKGGDGNGTAGVSVPLAGVDGTGGGGGGRPSAAKGGSGVFILSLPASQYSGNYTGDPAVSLVGLNVVLQWLASGSYTA